MRNIRLCTNYRGGNKNLGKHGKYGNVLNCVIADLFQLIISNTFFLMRNNDAIEKIIY